MNNNELTSFIAAGIGIVLLVLAFVAAPKSCEGGTELYFWSGVVALAALFALPFATRRGSSLSARLGSALALSLLGFGVWVAGLFVANVRILCRLF